MELFTRYVLENPWPLGVLLLAIAAGLAWSGLQAVDRRRLLAAGVMAVAGAAVMAAGRVVVTPGEHARAVVMETVDAAVAADVTRVAAAFADDSALSLGSPNNPGFSKDDITRRLEGLTGRYRIKSNRVVKLDATTVTRDRGVVDLACLTEPTLGFGPVPTSWVVQVDRQPDGSWKITHVTWVTMGNRAPPGSW
jgi:ketosteroid isomerase-like protein